MLFYLDENIQDSAREVLIAAGHQAFRITDFVAEGSPDPLVAKVAEENGAILVTHDSDFRRLSPRRNNGAQRFRKLSWVKMKCKEPRVAERLDTVLSLLEREYLDRQEMPDRRLIVEIQVDFVVVHR